MKLTIFESVQKETFVLHLSLPPSRINSQDPPKLARLRPGRMRGRLTCCIKVQSGPANETSFHLPMAAMDEAPLSALCCFWSGCWECHTGLASKILAVSVVMSEVHPICRPRDSCRQDVDISYACFSLGGFLVPSCHGAEMPGVLHAPASRAINGQLCTYTNSMLRNSAAFIGDLKHF